MLVRKAHSWSLLQLSVTTSHGTLAYRVVGFRVVEPNDLSVLSPTDDDTLTLITCYPFRYVGSAPQRFIVTARREADFVAIVAEMRDMF